MPHRRLVTLVALGASLVLLSLVGIAVVERVSANGRILHGVEVRGADISGTTTAAARDELEAMAPTLESEPWIASAGDQQFVLDPASIDYQVDPAATVAAARSVGRSRNPVDQLVGALVRRFRPDVVPLAATWDDAALDAVLDAWSAALAEGLQDGGLRFEGATVIEVEPRNGMGLDRARARSAIERSFHDASRAEIPLVVRDVRPDVRSEAVARAAMQARAILAQPVVVTMPGDEIVIPPESLGPTMVARPDGDELRLDIDVEALRIGIADRLAPFEVPAVDATFAIDGTSVSVVPAVVGRTVDLREVADAVLAGEHAVSGTLRDLIPARTTEWAQSLNITELVSSFTTSYPSGQPRVTNIQRAAELIDGTIVEPGETFSLNDTIGPRTAERGFVPAPAFSTQDGFYDELGGGVSQLSTTLFNATFFGGYEDVAHTPHTIYISRYPMGREATLNYGSIDNVFRNDSSSGILISAYAGDTSVTVSYYGNTEGRIVEAEGPIIVEEIPVVEELVENPFLPAGETEPVPGEGGYTGYVVENVRVIKRPGQPEVRERFTWTYDMRPHKVYVGTAPVAPPPEPPPLPPEAPAPPP